MKILENFNKNQTSFKHIFKKIPEHKRLEMQRETTKKDRLRVCYSLICGGAVSAITAGVMSYKKAPNKLKISAQNGLLAASVTFMANLIMSTIHRVKKVKELNKN